MDLDKTTFFEGLAEQLPTEEHSHYLVGEVEAGRVRRVEVTSDPIFIGRSLDADIQVVDPMVSGHHCRASLHGNNLLVEDLESTNGTYIDQRRVMGAGTLPVGSVLKVGRVVLKHEVLSRDEVQRLNRMADELDRATRYVLSLLPPPITTGPVRTSWRFIPSTHLGGDAFGYHWLDDDRFALYLLDVCGHGAGAALHSVTAIEHIRRGIPAYIDPGNPEAVLAQLNGAFPMERYGAMYLTIWYGVYHRQTRLLSYASAGHPPAYLRPPGSEDLVPLGTKSLGIGMLSDALFDGDSTTVPPGGRLYVFSDGIYEYRAKTGGHAGLDDFVPVLAEPEIPEIAETARVEQAIRHRMSGEIFDDDVSLLVVDFD